MAEKRRCRLVDVVVEGKCYVGGTITEAAVAIDEGVIVSVTRPYLAPRAEKRFVYSGKTLVLPGMVDMHVHMRDLEQKYKEDWFTGTLSAVRGGVTAVIDMPNNVPPANRREILLKKLALAVANSLVDFGFYLGYPPDLSELDKCAGLIAGVKLYPEDLHEPKLKPLFEKCAEKDILIVIHPEDPEVLEEAKKKLDSNLCNARMHCVLRPVEAEVRAVEKILSICEKCPSARVHFTHVSTRRAIELILLNKPRFNLSFDVTPHHVFLDSRLYETELCWLAKVNPPLRSPCDRDFLLACLRRLMPDALVTDHAPHSLAEKLRENYWEVPSGFPGLEVALPLLFTKIREGVLPLKVLDLYSSRPAEILGIAKGRIEVGFDGDLAVVEYGVSETIRGDKFASKAKYTPFEGWKVCARVVDVFLRGCKILERGELIAEKGVGRRVRKLESGSSWA